MRHIAWIALLLAAQFGCKQTQHRGVSELLSVSDGNPPTHAGTRLEVDLVVQAMRAIQAVDGTVATKFVVEACTANQTPDWSPIVSHFYCQIGYGRACYTGYLRDSSKPGHKTNRAYRDAYEACKSDPNFKYVDQNPLIRNAFKYIMFSVYDPGVDAFTLESQDEAINKFYGVTGPQDCDKRYSSSTDSRRPAADRCGDFAYLSSQTEPSTDQLPQDLPEPGPASDNSARQSTASCDGYRSVSDCQNDSSGQCVWVKYKNTYRCRHRNDSCGDFGYDGAACSNQTNDRCAWVKRDRMYWCYDRNDDCSKFGYDSNACTNKTNDRCVWVKRSDRMYFCNDRNDDCSKFGYDSYACTKKTNGRCVWRRNVNSYFCFAR